MNENKTKPSAVPNSELTAVRPERRRDPRTDAETTVLIYWMDSKRLPCEASAVVRNVSARGLAVSTERPFRTGDLVTVRTRDRSLTCAIRHVQSQPPNYLIGLEILAASDGSSHEESLIRLSSALQRSTESPPT